MKDFFDLIARGADTPPAADFLIKITDDCMLPYISPGQEVCVSCREQLLEMDAGIFLYNGKIICRQWCEDYAGALHLLCANPKRESENISIPRDARTRCLCLGRVILPHRLPPPVYD